MAYKENAGTHCAWSALEQAALCHQYSLFLRGKRQQQARPLCIRHFVRTLRCRINRMPKMPGQKVVLPRGQMPVHSAPQLPLCLRIHPFARRWLLPAAPCAHRSAPAIRKAQREKGERGFGLSDRLHSQAEEECIKPPLCAFCPGIFGSCLR